MTTNVQIALDCANPHRMADFWAGALHCEVERNDDAIRSLLEAGVATEADVMELDGGLVWREAAACEDPTGRLPRMYFQLVPEPKSVKNRVHLDIHVGADERDAEVERLLALGATRLYEGHQGPHSWITMADPEGNEFCVA
ncbi:MAG: VOC family protein [Acidimicrobiia bacterium]